MRCSLITFAILILFRCNNSEIIPPSPVTFDHKTYNETISSIDAFSLEAAVTVPNAAGAIDRNREGYFHVRFQLGMNTLSDLAIAQERVDALDAAIQTIHYAFSHQKPTGDFEIDIPEDLSYLGSPSEAELASGVAFFGSSLGLSLLSLTSSIWFQTSAETSQQRTSLQSFHQNVELVLEYLKEHEHLLHEVDRSAPNRLLFNSVAFHSLGRFLDDSEAISIAERFLNAALALQDDSLGYFIEGGGWDSSYNGVALQLGLELFMIMEDSIARKNLKAALQRSAHWQLSRIVGSGEISQEGNTRVFDGGESFLGSEKGIDYAKTAKSFIYISVLAEDEGFERVAERILDFYQ